MDRSGEERPVRSATKDFRSSEMYRASLGLKIQKEKSESGVKEKASKLKNKVTGAKKSAANSSSRDQQTQPSLSHEKRDTSPSPKRSASALPQPTTPATKPGGKHHPVKLKVHKTLSDKQQSLDISNQLHAAEATPGKTGMTSKATSLLKHAESSSAPHASSTPSPGSSSGHTTSTTHITSTDTVNTSNDSHGNQNELLSNFGSLASTANSSSFTAAESSINTSTSNITSSGRSDQQRAKRAPPELEEEDILPAKRPKTDKHDKSPETSTEKAKKKKKKASALVENQEDSSGKESSNKMDVDDDDDEDPSSQSVSRRIRARYELSHLELKTREAGIEARRKHQERLERHRANYSAERPALDPKVRGKRMQLDMKSDDSNYVASEDTEDTEEEEEEEAPIPPSPPTLPFEPPTPNEPADILKPSETSAEADLDRHSTSEATRLANIVHQKRAEIDAANGKVQPDSGSPSSITSTAVSSSTRQASLEGTISVTTENQQSSSTEPVTDTRSQHTASLVNDKYSDLTAQELLGSGGLQGPTTAAASTLINPTSASATPTVTTTSNSNDDSISTISTSSSTAAPSIPNPTFAVARETEKSPVVPHRVNRSQLEAAPRVLTNLPAFSTIPNAEMKESIQRYLKEEHQKRIPPDFTFFSSVASLSCAAGKKEGSVLIRLPLNAFPTIQPASDADYSFYKGVHGETVLPLTSSTGSTSATKGPPVVIKPIPFTTITRIDSELSHFERTPSLFDEIPELDAAMGSFAERGDRRKGRDANDSSDDDEGQGKSPHVRAVEKKLEKIWDTSNSSTIKNAKAFLEVMEQFLEIAIPTWHTSALKHYKPIYTDVPVPTEKSPTNPATSTVELYWMSRLTRLEATRANKRQRLLNHLKTEVSEREKNKIRALSRAHRPLWMRLESIAMIFEYSWYLRIIGAKIDLKPPQMEEESTLFDKLKKELGEYPRFSLSDWERISKIVIQLWKTTYSPLVRTAEATPKSKWQRNREAQEASEAHDHDAEEQGDENEDREGSERRVESRGRGGRRKHASSSTNRMDISEDDSATATETAQLSRNSSSASREMDTPPRTTTATTSSTTAMELSELEVPSHDDASYSPHSPSDQDNANGTRRVTRDRAMSVRAAAAAVTQAELARKNPEAREHPAPSTKKRSDSSPTSGPAPTFRLPTTGSRTAALFSPSAAAAKAAVAKASTATSPPSPHIPRTMATRSISATTLYMPTTAITSAAQQRANLEHASQTFPLPPSSYPHSGSPPASIPSWAPVSSIVYSTPYSTTTSSPFSHGVPLTAAPLAPPPIARPIVEASPASDAAEEQTMPALAVSATPVVLQPTTPAPAPRPVANATGLFAAVPSPYTPSTPTVAPPSAQRTPARRWVPPTEEQVAATPESQRALLQNFGSPARYNADFFKALYGSD